MTARTGHGSGAGVPRIETLPIDELPAGVPGEMLAEARGDRTDGGRFAPGNTGIARKGGLAKKNKTRLAVKLGRVALPDDAAFAPYKRDAVAFRRQQCASLALTVGGGICGSAPSSMVASASLQLAWSRFLSDRAALTGSSEDIVTASRLMNDSRQNLAAAHEYCAKEALARGRTSPKPSLADALKAGR